jgi:DHA1 family bicyclomycin/chloramphenicol resistance-like MFS transporter
MQKKIHNKSLLILILGAMTALSPFSIDMYLPAFQSMADDFHSTVAQVSLSLSSYFIGLSIGQIMYGPLLDRFGRKRPLYFGLVIYIFASILSMFSSSASELIVCRFIQALGGCSAGVASLAMVRDLFTVKESAKVLSLLVLILGVSPLFAPTLGGYLSLAFGWSSVFLTLALIATLLLITVFFKLPEVHAPDVNVQLKLLPILKTYLSILKHPDFYTNALTNAVAFSGLFVYLAGSPIIFMQTFGVGPKLYGQIFAFIAAGLIGSSQLNLLLLRKFTNQQILLAAISFQVCLGFIFMTGSYFDIFGLIGTVLMLFLFLGCFGLINPNGTSLALAPFATNAGSASALIGFLQMGIGALASMLIGLFNIKTMSPIISIMLTTSMLALTILTIGRRKTQKF